VTLPSGKYIFWTAAIAIGAVMFILPFISNLIAKKNGAAPSKQQ